MSEKTRLNVGVRFPSMNSLKTYFTNSIGEIYPELDDKFVMGTALAAKVLLRQVPSHEFAENKHLKDFWLVRASSDDDMKEKDGTTNGTCLSELKCKGMVRWGVRRQVKFLERHQEMMNALNMQSSSSFDDSGKSNLKLEAIDQRKLFEENEEDDEDDNEKDDEEEEVDVEEEDDKDDEDIAVEEEAEMAEMEETRESEENLKRKRYKLRSNSGRRLSKKVKGEKKRQKKSHGNKGRNKCRELLVLENPKDRWSAER